MYTEKHADEVVPGDRVLVEWDYCREDFFPVKATKALPNGEVAVTFAPKRVQFQGKRVALGTMEYPATHSFLLED